MDVRPQRYAGKVKKIDHYFKISPDHEARMSESNDDIVTAIYG